VLICGAVASTYHGVRAGTVLPCIAAARGRGMEAIVINPNHPGRRLLAAGYGARHGMVNSDPKVRNRSQFPKD
jgi:hypothetical protein